MAMEYRMIEFVSYDGEFPNLCEGLLVVRIDGRLYAFSPYSDRSCIDGSGAVTIELRSLRTTVS